MKKQFYTYAVYLIVLVLFSQNAFAQLTPQARWPKASNGKFVCFTDEMEKYRLAVSGQTDKQLSFENRMKAEQEKLINQSNFFRTTPIIYTIPVIFHIIHNGEPTGTGRNIAKAFIDSQIVQINDDFRRIANTSGFNNHANGADVEIQFVAATLNPTNGVLAEPGIERINRNAKGWTAPPHLDTYMQSTIKPNSSWNPDKYLNIWVCDLTDATGTVLGYAQGPVFPGNIGQDDDTTSTANTDGIVLHYSVIGSSKKKPAGSYPFDEGRICTHELGHFFGLRHVWGEGNCDFDDYVFDTPRQSGVIFGCNPNSNTCNDMNYGSPYDSVDMVRNYMQYSDGACVNIFTLGQKNRMRIVMGETGAGSPRRESLRFSDRAMSKPNISFIRTDTTVIERTTCNLQWGFNIPVKISGPPTGTTYAKIVITGNTNGQDFTLTPDSVSFSPTDTADKYFTVAINADAVMEGHEKAIFTLVVSDTNSLAAPDAYELTIMNDDYIPIMGKRINTTIFTEDFENPSSGWIKHNYIKGSNTWLIGGSNGDVSSGKSAYISKDSSSLTYNAASLSRTLIYHEISAYNRDSLAVSFYYKCKGENTSGVKQDFGKLMYSLDSLTFYQVNGTEDLTDSSNTTNFSAMLPYFLWNTKFYLGFYWQNDTANANNPPFAIDDIVVSGKTYITASIHTTVDTTFGSAQKPLGPMETVDFYDKVTGDVLATIQNLTPHNYGCVSVAIDRAGTNAQYVNNDPQTTAQNKLFDRTYKIIPQYNNPSGQYTVTFYLTQAEVMGWMLATGNPLSNIDVIKDTGYISNTDYYGPYEQMHATIANYLGGINRTVTATFNTGFSGFGFGHITTGTLPVHIISFSATENNKTVDLFWKTDNEENLAYYKVLRSRDGINFEAIGTVTARGSNGTTEEYRMNDPQPFAGKNFYQLRAFDRNQSFKNSRVVEVDILSGMMFSVAPNPFTDKIIIGKTNAVQQNLQIKMTDLHGRTIVDKQVKNAAGPTTINIPAITAGIYLLKITTEEGTQVFKLVKE